ncbi:MULTISPECIES: DapH/DapD/GlmU-related protein [unclassified Sphingobacterium]|uniref:acyltransferase n=1 Tax=unclassified Sphingobacterium TaxID=2609468 RepID=UPI0025FF0BC1|nr:MULTISPECIES: acyltransferase [unclassified Sphingobacterium]
MQIFTRVRRFFFRKVYVDFILRLSFKLMGQRNVIGLPLQLTPDVISIGSDCYIYKNCRIEGVKEYEGVKYRPSISIGNFVSIQQNLHLTCADNISVGDYVAIAANVTITDIEHPYEDVNIPIEKAHLNVKPVRIGAETKIYNNSVILPGTILGKHCVVGANSVVSGIFPDFCVIVGTPARIVKRYSFKHEMWLRTDKEGNFLS